MLIPMTRLFFLPLQKRQSLLRKNCLKNLGLAKKAKVRSFFTVRSGEKNILFLIIFHRTQRYSSMIMTVSTICRKISTANMPVCIGLPDRTFLFFLRVKCFFLLMSFQKCMRTAFLSVHCTLRPMKRKMRMRMLISLKLNVSRQKVSLETSII